MTDEAKQFSNLFKNNEKKETSDKEIPSIFDNDKKNEK